MINGARKWDKHREDNGYTKEVLACVVVMKK